MPWTHNADGSQSCTDHPDAPAFPGHIGCTACHAAPPPLPVEPEPGEAERLCAEAEAQGLPDSLTVESRAWTAWQEARADAIASRALAAMCVERGRQFADGELAATYTGKDGQPVIAVSADNEDQARKWLSLAAVFTQATSKSLDVQGKLLKLGNEATAVRERRAAKERRDRLVQQLRGRGSN